MAKELGGFADLPIVEDYEFVRRLRGVDYINSSMTTNPAAGAIGTAGQQLPLASRGLFHPYHHAVPAFVPVGAGSGGPKRHSGRADSGGGVAGGPPAGGGKGCCCPADRCLVGHLGRGPDRFGWRWPVSGWVHRDCNDPEFNHSSGRLRPRHRASATPCLSLWRQRLVGPGTCRRNRAGAALCRPPRVFPVGGDTELDRAGALLSTAGRRRC